MVKTIGTHSGHFHCDEALAVALLKITEEFKDSVLVRTRDSSELEKCDIIVDVGGVYDVATHRYDHHQRGFTETFDEKHATKLSSAGLVYKHFGKEVVGKILGNEVSSNDAEKIYLKTYDCFIEALDANDNGISAYPSSATPLFKESPTSLSDRVGKKNPAWNEVVSNMEIDKRFEEASQLAGEEFVDYVLRLKNTWLPARTIVVDALDKASEVHFSGQVIALERACPWKEHLVELEVERSLTEDKSILYVLYPEGSPDGNWRIQCVSVRPESFENRKSLPEAWRGFRDNELSAISGVDSCIFVHAGGFIGGNKSRQGVCEMARLALEL
ncbi:metal-dependent protein hydrolase [Sporodiniella umbellata]|nr:metal-dependent protein hydrolase [Sporodiniella umbellata]